MSDDQPKLSELDAIFFDFGETLATLSPTKEELFVRAAQAVGLELELAAVQRAYQVVDFHNKYSSVDVVDRAAFYDSYNKKLAEALGIDSHFPALGPALEEQFRTAKKWQLFSEVPDVLKQLRESGVTLALVANWDDNLSSLVAELGIRDFFTAVVASQTAGVEKPNPAIFLLAATKLSLSIPTNRILYVGNEYRADVMGARAAGLIPVLIDRNQLFPHADCARFPSLRQWLANAK